MKLKRLFVVPFTMAIALTTAVHAQETEPSAGRSRQQTAVQKDETALVGVVIPKPPFDTCMQGKPTHLLLSGDRDHRIKSTRLVGANRTTIRQLAEAAKNGQPVRVTGHWIAGVEANCDLLSVTKLEQIR